MTLHSWLNSNPSIRDAIYWEKQPDSDASGGPYTSWSTKRKSLLQAAYEAAVNNQPTGLVDPPPNLADLGDADAPRTVIASDRAWKLYVTHVAHSLAVEIHKRVDWSIKGWSHLSLQILLDSRQFFRWTDDPEGYVIDFDLSGDALPAPPDCSWRFLNDNNLISRVERLKDGESPPIVGLINHRRQTIGRALEWCRANMIHFNGGYTAKNMESAWQYRGLTPVSRVISGTHNHAYSVPSMDFRHWTGGCHGTTGFLRAVLRVVNIPVENVRICGHSLTHFRVEHSYLSHGDDPYDLWGKPFPKDAPPPWPADALLIDDAKFAEWFGAAVPDDKKCKNVNRRPMELSIERLPPHLLSTYCQDKKAGKSHAKGEVAKALCPPYTLAELDAADLWNRLDQKIASLGGCKAIPGGG